MTSNCHTHGILPFTEYFGGRELVRLCDQTGVAEVVFYVADCNTIASVHKYEVQISK